MKLPTWRLLRCYRVAVPEASIEQVWNFLHKKRRKNRIYRKADGASFFYVSKEDWNELQSEVPALASVATVEIRGLIPFLDRHRSRAGLLAGCLLAALLFFLLGGRVWDVRISGNESLSRGQIMAELASAGLTVGTPLSGLDTKAVAGDVLLSAPDLSFVSIHMRGTVAYVRVIEHKRSEQSEEAPRGANLIAATDAVVDTLSVKQGAIQVHPGQVVRQGDLLVSGIVEGAGGSRILRANGEVYGRVTRRFEVVLPRGSAVKQTAHRQTVGLALVFWGKSINIYANTGNLPPTYDTIYEREQAYIGESTRLPFGLVRTVAVSYEESAVSLADEAIVSLAYRRLIDEMTVALRGGELLRKSITGYFTEDAYVLVCEAECLENIAAVAEIDAR